MKITPDTNVLLRMVKRDDLSQSAAALKALEAATLVVIGVHAVCELAWVLSSTYAMPRPAIAIAIRGLVASGNVVTNWPAINAGLAVLDAGGDFADGVIAFEGRWLGGETFVTFDKKAVRLLQDQGVSSQLLA